MIFAGTKGFLSDIPASEVTRFEAELYPFVEAKYPEVLDTIRTKKMVDKETEELLNKVLEEFKTVFSVN
jgi:F-type H+-transporting ATPase subunit alpha